MSRETPGPQGGRRNLGRGLAALFGEEDDAREVTEPARGGQHLPVARLQPSAIQPRRRFRPEDMETLVASVREKGVLQPLMVRPVTGSADQFEIIAGERRWRAAQAAGVHEVPVIIRAIDDAEALEIALIENIQRENLTPLEEAEGYRRLMEEFAHTQENLARAVGKSRSHVANMMRLLNLPAPVKDMLDDGRLTVGHARALLNAPDSLALAREAVTRGWTVRRVEREASRAERGEAGSGKGAARPRKGRDAAKDADTLALEHDLSVLLGLKVAIALKGEAGEMTIHFSTLEQLDDVLHRLKRGPETNRSLY